MNFTKTLAVLAAFAALTCGAAHAAPLNLVVNGGFETTTNGAGQIINGYTTATGWTSTGYNFVFAAGTADTKGANGTYGNLKLWGPGTGSANGLTNSPVGGNFLAADGAYQTQAIQQTISGLVVGQKYDLSFYWAGAQQSGYNGLNAEQWIVSLGNQTISTALVQNSSHGFTGWMEEKFTYTATSTTEVLSFLAHGVPNGVPPFSLLDGVSLKAQVPEPSTIALFFAGLAVVGGASRFRRRNDKA
jgi:hypothetical protein